MNDWAAVTAFALSLPDTALAPYYGVPAPKVNGKAFVSRSPEPDSFHVATTHDEKAVLLATNPAKFWQTPHYDGWPGVLVRFGSDDADRVRLTITRAWWDPILREGASRAQRKAFGARP